jgi:signal transduction histidine kinase
MSDGALIIDNSGEILYVNDVMKEKFKKLELEENKDFLDTIYPESFEKTIKKYVMEVISKGEKKDACTMFIPEMNLEFTIKSALYKNSNGDFLGAVFVITDLQERTEMIDNEIRDYNK